MWPQTNYVFVPKPLWVAFKIVLTLLEMTCCKLSVQLSQSSGTDSSSLAVAALCCYSFCAKENSE